MSEKCIEQEIVDKALELARQFYESHGYEVEKGYKFYESTHPQEQAMWNLACIAYEHIEGTEVEDARQFIEGYE